jgi:hypothetical protein
MKWRMVDLKKIIGSAAPLIATALGGPLAGAAVATLSRALFGNDKANEEQIAQYFSDNSADAFVKLKEAEYSFQVKLAEIEQASLQLNLDNTRDARAMNVASFAESGSWLSRNITPILALINHFIFITTIILLMKVNVDSDAKDALLILVGVIASNFNGVREFYFGSSLSSQNKDNAINNFSKK